jgi:hypothetical protein
MRRAVYAKRLRLPAVMTVGGARRSLASEPARDQDGVRIHLPIRGKMPREVKTAYEAVQCIKSGDRVVVQGQCIKNLPTVASGISRMLSHRHSCTRTGSSATPVSLTQAMTDWGKAAGKSRRARPQTAST